MRALLLLACSALSLLGCFRAARDWEDPIPPSRAPQYAPGAIGRQTVCEVEQVVVREDHAILVARGREERVPLAALEDRLHSALSGCALGPGEPILWADGRGSVDALSAAQAVAQRLTDALSARGLKMPPTNAVFEGEPDPPAYRSRSELGAAAALVPEDFDFRRYLLVRMPIPGSERVQTCLDQDLGLSAEEAEAVETQRAEERRRLNQDPPQRLVYGRYTYAWGLLLAGYPAPERPEQERGPCATHFKPIPALVALPQTELRVRPR